LPQEQWTAYFLVNNGIVSQSWLWFLPVLFLFNLMYAGFSILKIRIRVSTKIALVLVFFSGLGYSIGMDVMGWQGWTKTTLINFQNERLLIYALMFVLGSLFFQKSVFQRHAGSKQLLLASLMTVWLPLFSYRYFYANEAWYGGTIVFSETIDVVLLWSSFHLSLFGLLVIMINLFWIYFKKSSKLMDGLNANSYSVYIIHTIVIGFLAWSMLNIGMPSMVKFILLTTAAYVSSNLLVYFYGRAAGVIVLYVRNLLSTLKHSTSKEHKLSWTR
jgi:hypothetical protein